MSARTFLQRQPRLAGFIMPADEVRGRDLVLPAQVPTPGFRDPPLRGAPCRVGEKRSSLRQECGTAGTTFRLLNKIARVGRSSIGIRKSAAKAHDANALYRYVLGEAIKRLDAYCREDRAGVERFLLALDEHQQRAALLTAAAQDMYGGDEPRRQLIEPPLQLESHRYQTIQAADWIAGLVGRLGAIWTEPDAWPENVVFRRYFESRLTSVQVRSGVRGLGRSFDVHS